MKKLLIFLLIVLISSTHAQAQQEKQYPFKHYNVNNGLAAYNANSVIQDDQGFIWIGTINGLQRFDGNRFITFRRNPGDINALPDNYIVQLHFDKNKQLWILFGNGQIGTFDTRAFTYNGVKIKVSDENYLKLKRKLVEDSDGKLICVINRLESVTYNKKNNEFSAEYNEFKVPAGWKVISLFEDQRTKKYWIYADSGICMYNTRNKSLSYYGHNTEKAPFIDRFGNTTGLAGFMIDNQSRLWFEKEAPSNGEMLINCYDLAADFLVLDRYNAGAFIKKPNETKTLLQQKDGSVWLGGLHVFMKYVEEENRFQPVRNGNSTEQSIYYNEINCLFEDSEENVWVTTNNNGLYVFKPSHRLFTSIIHTNRISNKEDEGSIMCFVLTNDNQVLAGVSGDGIHKYDLNFNAVKADKHSIDERKPYTIWNMCGLKNGKAIWMGLQNGLLIYDQLTAKTNFYNPPVFENSTIRQVAEDKQGNIWLGTNGRGVFKWTPSRAAKQFEDGFSKLKSIPNTLIEKISIDSKGYVWVCTMMNGVYRIDPLTDSITDHITTEGPASRRLYSNAAAAAFEYNDSIMIIVTGTLNIYNTKSNSIDHITSADGLPSDIVTSIEKDSKGYIWMGLFNGLCRMNLAKRSFTYYDRDDGMANDNFNLAASYRLPDGRMLFGTSTDFVVFNPDDVNTSIHPPDVRITEFKLLNRSLSVDSLQQLSKIELAPDQNFITIGFSGLSYLNKNKWSYFYTLSGMEKEWTKANELQQVNYNYLPPGTYTFKVRTGNGDDIASKNITELRIKVNPPFWKTWWFYAIIIVSIALLLYGFDRERMRRKEGMQKMRSEIADNLHEDVNTALSNINILSEMAKLKAHRDPEKSTEYFEQIRTKSHNMMIAMDDMLWSIDPRNDNMQKTVDRMKEFVDAFRNGNDVNIDVLVDKKIAFLNLNMKQRHDVFFLIKEGIKNAVQAGAKNFRIHIGLEKDKLLYSIQVDNDGCDIQQLTGLFQRQELDKRRVAIHAVLKTHFYNKSSLFELYVPVSPLLN